MELPHLSRDRNEPFVDQVARHYRHAIQDGRLRPGDRLPTIRAVAEHTGVNRATVQDAYRRLRELGLVSATVGRGTSVVGPKEAQRPPISPGARAAWQHLREQTRVPDADRRVPTVANFAELLPDHDLFPVEGFRESLERVLQSRGGKLLRYGQPTGNLELRQLLAERDQNPGTDPGTQTADADEILVTNGAQQGIDLVLRAFTRPGDAVAVAIPTYHHLFGLLKAHGLHVAPLRAGPEGIDLDDLARALARPDVRLLYLMPTFHNPTGRTLDLAARRAVMGLVRGSQVPVLEDESELELRFRGEALPSFRSLDPRDLTVTVRTFSKGLFPGVRLGWVHAGRDILGPMAALKRYIDLETSPLLQAALVDFARRGALDAYLEPLRAELGRRHRAAGRALAKSMPAGSSWSDPDGGFALWVEGPPGINGRDLAARAAARGVLVSPGQLFCPDDEPVPGMRLSLSRSDEAQIQNGIRVLGRCASELAAQTESPSKPPLFL